MPLRLPAPRAVLQPIRPPQLLIPSRLAAARRFSSTGAPVRVDQTRKGNKPDGELRDEHHEQAAEAKGGGGAKAHPAKQPDQQAKAGGGAAGAVAQKDREAVEAAEEHSVKKPMPGVGNKAGGRGGTAL